MKRLILAALVADLAILSTAQAAGPSATLNWSAPTVNTDGTTISAALTFNVYQGVKGAETQAATGVTATTWSAPASALVPGTTVCWQVTAVEGGQESARSTEACKTFPLPTPLAPSGLTVQ